MRRSGQVGRQPLDLVQASPGPAGLAEAPRGRGEGGALGVGACGVCVCARRRRLGSACVSLVLVTEPIDEEEAVPAPA
jgi:hypothetical protein